MSKYIETANELTKGLNSLFSSLTLGKFLKWIISIIIILAVVLFIYENFFSSSFYYDKIDRKLQIIEKIKELSPNDSLIKKTANQKLLETLNDLDAPENKYLSFKEFNLSVSDTFWQSIIKILGAILVPILIIISVRKDPDKTNAITGSIAFMVIFGIIAVFIPVIYNVWVNFILMPIAEILVLLPFILKNKK